MYNSRAGAPVAMAHKPAGGPYKTGMGPTFQGYSELGTASATHQADVM